MLEIRDPAIKLFGMTIPIIGDDVDSPRDFDESSNCSNDCQLKKDSAEDDSMETDADYELDDHSPPSKEDSEDQLPNSESDENQQEPDTEKETESPKDEKDSNNSQQKSALKKPDKILPCPRCNSMDTKFCYYNNYNVNQPRHFCKSCQRYWTSGGTMRNVPVGAGRRKNKGSSSRYYHITMSEALQAVQTDVTNGSCPELKTNGVVLTFGPDNPQCESMTSGKNGFNSSGTTISHNGVKNDKRNMNGFTNQVPCFQWPPYLWNPGAVPVPAFCPSGYAPMSFYPAPYWDGAIPWNVPWVSPCSPASQGQKSPGSNLNSPLGKHSRDGEMLKSFENKKSSGTNTTVLVPKTLRIDDPIEAAKSSIWTTLGIKKDKRDPLSTGGFFNSFKSTKDEEKGKRMDTHQSRTANPAAFCRSINFQESASR